MTLKHVLCRIWHTLDTTILQKWYRSDILWIVTEEDY